MSSVCGPCLEGSKKNPAEKWCVDCEEYLCSGCVGHHQTLKLTRQHYLIDITSQNYGSGSVQSMRGLCHNHPSRDFKNYCPIHDALVCDDCMATSHFSCRGTIVPMDIASVGVKSSPQFINLKTDVANIRQNFIYVAECTEKVESEFRGQVASVRSKIRETKMRMVKYIDLMEQSLQNELQLKENEVLEKISSEKSKVQSGLMEAAMLSAEVLSVLNSGSDRQAFILMHVLKLFKGENELKSREMSCNVDHCSLTTDMADPAIFENTVNMQFGKIAVEWLPLHLQLTQNLKIIPTCFEQEGTIDTGKYVQEISVNDEGDLILVELNVISSSRVYKYNDKGEKLNEVKFEGSPTDVAAIPGGSRVMVLVDGERVLNFDMDIGFKMEQTINMAKDCCCIAASTNAIYIGINDEIIVMDLEGKYIRTSKVAKKPIKCVCASQDGDVYYAIADSIYCMKEYGEETCLYKSNDLRDVRGIAMDMVGNIYISGNKSNNIHILKKSNGLAEIILKKEHGIKRPKGICIDKVRSKLYVHFGGYSPIQVYKIS